MRLDLTEINSLLGSLSLTKEEAPRAVVRDTVLYGGTKVSKQMLIGNFIMHRDLHIRNFKLAMSQS